MKNRAIFIEFRMCDFHWGKYFLNMIVGKDSESKEDHQISECKKEFDYVSIKNSPGH